MIPNNIVAPLNQIKIALAVFREAPAVISLILFTFADFQIAPLVLEFIFENYCDTAADALKFGHLVEFLLNFQECMGCVRHAYDTGVEGWEFQNLSIDETPSFVCWAFEPIAERKDEQVNAKIRLVVNKEQLTLHQQHLPHDVGYPRARSIART